MITKERAIEILNRQIALTKELKDDDLLSHKFDKWKRDTEIAVEMIFGKDTRHLTDFSNVTYTPLEYSDTTSHHFFEEVYHRGLDEAAFLLLSFIQEIEDFGIQTKPRRLFLIGATIKQLFLRIWKDPVWSKVIAAGIIILFGAVGIWFSGDGNDGVKKNKVSTDKVKPPIILKAKLPYLKNVPILDKTLYIKNYYDYLVIGGKNISKVKIAARTNDSRSSDPHIRSHDKEIGYDIYRKPYVELEYNNKFYSIEIDGEIFNYHFTLKEVTLPTMDLDVVFAK